MLFATFADVQRAGLVERIRREPDNHLARLVAADWFEENGQPARAEYIRLAVWLADNPKCIQPVDAAFRLGNFASGFSTRCQECGPCVAWEYFQAVAAATVFEAPGRQRGCPMHYDWDRGFPRRVNLSVTEWTEPDAEFPHPPAGRRYATTEPVVPVFQDRHPRMFRHKWTWAQGDARDGAGVFFPFLTGKWVYAGVGPRIGYATADDAVADLGRAAVAWALAWTPPPEG